ncbi:phosphatase PAP2 family protein [Clostridium brassicae]|uniref:Phosphatase PAP2 family protein n=1 Tax=Clostridium brassicae TaxID=2999072 RepID=A0ABT4D6S8_9CLOT|nr:phosphatase PAP2 family protein [Clostridium brassicae]MCY6958000.1 phosphatase PAP2 family protein [Clostridium brassicae]
MQREWEESDYQIRNIIKKGILMATIPVTSILYPTLNVYREDINVMKMPIDNIISFNKYFVIPYVGWYAYIFFFLLLLCILDSDEYFKLLITLNVGILICYVIYYFYPTYVARPIIEDKDIFSRLVLWVYGRDNPYNCMPSIHVLNSMLVLLFVNNSSKISSSFKMTTDIITILISLSTMFIKQHYFIDVIVSIGLSLSLFYSMNWIWKLIKDKRKKAKI